MKNLLKNLITSAALLALTLLLALPAAAQLSEPINGFGVGTTNPATTLSYLVVSQRSANGGAPAVTFLSVGSDKATSQVQFYKVTHTVGVTATNSTTTLSVNNTNGFASGDIVVIRHARDDTYERRILTTMTAATNLILTTATLGAVLPNDTVYRVVTTGAGTIPWGATTNTIAAGAGGPIYVGQKGKPLLIEIDSTSTSGRLMAGGVYLP